MKFLSCSNCDQLFLMFHEKEDSVTCCGMKLNDIPEKKIESISDEHYPKIRKAGNFLTVKVNEQHPMVETHHISDVLIKTNQGFQYKSLTLNNAVAKFVLSNSEILESIYLYCNIHFIQRLDCNNTT